MKDSATVRVMAKGVTITFSGIDVVKAVDLELRRGEIHALVGENGAGKSSLAKAIAGVYRLSAGELALDGQVVRFRKPDEALAAGVALIHQEPLCFPDLSVGENVFVGHQPRRAGLVDWKQLETKARSLLQSVGCLLDPRSSVAGISVAQQQRIELACALSHQATVWIFDETTAPLTPKEVSELFTIVRGLRGQGHAILMVTHHLHEVFEIADRITVLRDGAKVGERLTAETSIREIVQMMVGRELIDKHFVGSTASEVLLEVENLSGLGFHDISLKVRKGEILGIAGLVGAGRTELARALFGIASATSGNIKLGGTVIKRGSTKAARKAGIAMVPEDRRQDGLFLSQSIAFNSTLANLEDLSINGWLNSKDLQVESQKLTERLHLAHRSQDQSVEELSGGNQQKVVLAKWLMTSPKLLILDEPTRGVDVGAKHEVHQLIRSLADEGMGVLMISSDLPEILRLSDRIAVMREGTIVAEMLGPSATEETVMLAATGQQVANEA